MVGGNIERLNEAKLVPEGKQVVALSAGLRNNCSLSLNVYILANNLALQASLRIKFLLLESSLATKFYNLKKKTSILIPDHTNVPG